MYNSTSACHIMYTFSSENQKLYYTIWLTMCFDYTKNERIQIIYW